MKIFSRRKWGSFMVIKLLNEILINLLKVREEGKCAMEENFYSTNQI